ncbi:hypothetical protein HYH03_004401 [Edaphochlamys debaryana]|uniref:Kri1-like C-terminal domain-containing protein n=1 Tax=Edaphochlamys debaryana TaxID=47281 RepID=A0A835Y9Y4_9CHLO|nr:hypothetical protein HYH03_004401 [Edaphochlamys debaryana]|eukprot:KAG2497662.1 hypothetical protein HYH03_004401 [Edaphochlamys debaryana]
MPKTSRGPYPSARSTDFEDSVGGVKTRFRYKENGGGTARGERAKTRFQYKEVPSNTFGLSVDDILCLDDKSLNQVVGMKRLAPYRKTLDRLRPNYKALAAVKGEAADKFGKQRRQQNKKQGWQDKGGPRQGGQWWGGGEGGAAAGGAGAAAGAGPGSAADADAKPSRPHADAQAQGRGEDRKRKDRPAGEAQAGPGPGSAGERKGKDKSQAAAGAAAAAGGEHGGKGKGGAGAGRGERGPAHGQGHKEHKEHKERKEHKPLSPQAARLASFAVPTLKKDQYHGGGGGAGGGGKGAGGAGGVKRKRGGEAQQAQQEPPSDGPQLSRAQKKNMKRSTREQGRRGLSSGFVGGQVCLSVRDSAEGVLDEGGTAAIIEDLASEYERSKAFMEALYRSLQGGGGSPGHGPSAEPAAPDPLAALADDPAEGRPGSGSNHSQSRVVPDPGAPYDDASGRSFHSEPLPRLGGVLRPGSGRPSPGRHSPGALSPTPSPHGGFGGVRSSTPSRLSSETGHRASSGSRGGGGPLVSDGGGGGGVRPADGASSPQLPPAAASPSPAQRFGRRLLSLFGGVKAPAAATTTTKKKATRSHVPPASKRHTVNGALPAPPANGPGPTLDSQLQPQPAFLPVSLDGLSPELVAVLTAPPPKPSAARQRRSSLDFSAAPPSHLRASLDLERADPHGPSEARARQPQPKVRASLEICGRSGAPAAAAASAELMAAAAASGAAVVQAPASPGRCSSPAPGAPGFGRGSQWSQTGGAVGPSGGGAGAGAGAAQVASSAVPGPQPPLLAVASPTGGHLPPLRHGSGASAHAAAATVCGPSVAAASPTHERGGPLPSVSPSMARVAAVGDGSGATEARSRSSSHLPIATLGHLPGPDQAPARPQAQAQAQGPHSGKGWDVRRRSSGTGDPFLGEWRTAATAGPGSGPGASVAAAGGPMRAPPKGSLSDGPMAGLLMVGGHNSGGVSCSSSLGGGVGGAAAAGEAGGGLSCGLPALPAHGLHHQSPLPGHPLHHAHPAPAPPSFPHLSPTAHGFHQQSLPPGPPQGPPQASIPVPAARATDPEQLGPQKLWLQSSLFTSGVVGPHVAAPAADAGVAAVVSAGAAGGGH